MQKAQESFKAKITGASPAQQESGRSETSEDRKCALVPTSLGPGALPIKEAGDQAR